MPKVRIVTDSTAHFFDPAFPEKHNVTVVPLTIHFGKHAYVEGTGITAEQFTAVYTELCQTTDQILSIHVSGKLSRTTQNARTGAEGVLGRCKVQVIDTLSTSIGLGVLVEAAALAAGRGESQEEIVRIVRGMIPRLYTVFFIEHMDFLANAGRIGKAQATLGAMLGIKPFLTLEDGDIVPMEKVRTRQQAVEKLLEFVVEFSAIDHAAILQSSPVLTEDTRLLLERLAIDFPGRQWPVLTYGPSLGTFLGPDAMGIVICEGEEELE